MKWRATCSRSARSRSGSASPDRGRVRGSERLRVVRGGDSEVVPEPLVEAVCEAMPNCEVVTVPGGHVVMWDAFDETASAILGFLENSRP